MHDNFKVDVRALSKPRQPGISAYMRIKNEQQLVRVAILSHIEHYDEIIACYNDCTDNTVAVLTELARQYPRKLKVHHYQPKVHPLGSREYEKLPDDSVHGLANYYNYALSKTTRRMAVKLDADHLAISHKLTPLLDTIRRDMAAGKRKIYMFSGINLLRDKRSVIGVTENNPFSGINDINYHPVNEHAVYRNSQRKDSFNKTYRRSLETEYMGIMYFHLKGLKSGLCAPEFPAENFSSRDGKPFEETKIVSFEEFCSAQCHQRLRRQLNPYHRLFSVLYAGERMREWKYRLTGAPPRLAQVRLARLAKDLDGIDFKRDVLDPLDAWEFNPDALHAK